MTRSELIASISEIYPYMSLSDVDRIVTAVLDSIVETLESGGRVELRGFGSFSIRERRQIQGRNPRTGENVQVSARKVPFFKAGKYLKDLINGRDPGGSARL